MPKPKYPKKGLLSYLIPFILIFALIGSGVYFASNRFSLDDFMRVIRAPEVAKDEKVTIVFQEGNNQLKPWSSEEWEVLHIDSFLQAGDTLKTSRGGTIVLRFFEDSEVRIKSDSEVKLIRLDRDEVDGNNVALELIKGQLWRRGPQAANEESDFIVTTTHQIVQMQEAVMIDISSDPEITRVIGGDANINVAKKILGARKPISRLALIGGEQILLDELVLDQLRVGEKDVITAIDQGYLASEWYSWNLDKEERLGFIVEVAEQTTSSEELPPLEEGLVAITAPSEGDKTGGSILVQGTFDADQVEKVMVNNQEALLGLNGDWERVTELSSQNNVVSVTAVLQDDEQEYLVANLELEVDNLGPALGSIRQPSVDENNNGILTTDTLELIGEVSDDAVRVCVTHNDSDTPYCLKQFSAGDETYRYLGGITYGNVVEGKNKYSITAYDELGNAAIKTIYLFKGIEKPDEKLEEDTLPEAPQASSTSSDLKKPTITSPDPSQVFETSNQVITLVGTVDPKSQSLLINDKKVSYEAGSAGYEISYELSEGENILKIQSLDANGSKSKTAVLTVLYFPESENSSTED